MAWRRIDTSSYGGTLTPARPYAPDLHKLSIPDTVKWPWVEVLDGGIGTGWRKHMVARNKLITWFYNDSNVKITTDFGWSDWELFDPFDWVTGGVSVRDGTTRFGETRQLETSELCYPWQIYFRRRTRDAGGGGWSYTEESMTILPGTVYEVEIDAASGKREETHDAMILVPC